MESVGEQCARPTRGRPRKRGRSGGNRVNSGRKKIYHREVSRATMYRRVKKLRECEEYSTLCLEIAARNALSPTTDSESIECPTSLIPHTSESAFAFYLEHNYTKSTYRELVKDCRSRKSRIYPGYTTFGKVMLQCRPEKYEITEKVIYVPLQNLLNKSVERLCDSVALDWEQKNLYNLQFVGTLGFDSSSGHLNPQQHSADPINENSDAQSSLFVTSVLLIKLESTIDNTCLWINPTPQSTRFCRPLRIGLEKESSENILIEYGRLNEEINKLVYHKFQMSNGKRVKVNFKISQTLFDGKCINTITENKSSSRCPICCCTVHEFGNLTSDFSPKPTSLKYGLGLLHAEIKALEHLLNLSYRKIIETWDVREPVKEQFQQRKEYIKKKLYENLGVRVDEVLQGHGTTNTGNVARRCFENPEKFCDALEIDMRLVINISTILCAFKCKKKLKLLELESFCWKTYKLYYQLYPWARMNPSLHKLLRHGCEIAREFPLPLIYYSEDANESWHKLYRKNMIDHARQNDRESRLLDVFNRAIYLTDPYISLILIDKRIKLQKKRQITDDVKQFVEESEILDEHDDDESGSDHD